MKFSFQINNKLLNSLNHTPPGTNHQLLISTTSMSHLLNTSQSMNQFQLLIITTGVNPHSNLCTTNLLQSNGLITMKSQLSSSTSMTLLLKITTTLKNLPHTFNNTTNGMNPPKPSLCTNPLQLSGLNNTKPPSLTFTGMM